MEMRRDRHEKEINPEENPAFTQNSILTSALELSGRIKVVSPFSKTFSETNSKGDEKHFNKNKKQKINEHQFFFILILYKGRKKKYIYFVLECKIE